MNNILECSSKLSTIGITASFLLTNKEIKTSYSIKSSKNRQLIVIRAPNHKKKKQEHDHKISNKIKNNKRKIAIHSGIFGVVTYWSFTVYAHVSAPFLESELHCK